MVKEKLVVVIMGQDCEKFIDLALESVKEADAVVYIDGGSLGDTLKIVRHYKKMYNHNFTILSNNFDQDDPKMNGIQRNTYLNYIKERYFDDWCLAIDADELVADIEDVKKAINSMPGGVYSVKMRHFIGDLGHEDATSEEHFVPNRLFKISCTDKYPEVEHPVLQAKEGVQVGRTKCTTIWHLRECLGIFETYSKYESNLIKSNMHTKEQLDKWYYLMIRGQYPKKEVGWYELPQVIRKRFKI